MLSWLLSRSRSAAWDHGILHLPFHPEPFRGPEVATMMLLVRYLAQQAQYPLHLPLFLPGPWPPGTPWYPWHSQELSSSHSQFEKTTWHMG